MKTTIKGILALAILTTLLFPAYTPAQTSVDVQYVWTAPTTGTPVVHYVVQHSTDSSAWVTLGNVTELTYTLSAEPGVSHQIRVAGVDAQGRQGPYSAPSEPYTPEPTDTGAPGQPGTPVRVQNL